MRRQIPLSEINAGNQLHRYSEAYLINEFVTMAVWDVSRETSAARNELKTEPSSILSPRGQQLSFGLGSASVSSFPGVTSRAH